MTPSRYPPNFSQSIHPRKLAELPPFATYEGTAPDLLHLRGLLIRTTDIESVVYVGEREQVWVERPDGSRWRPWAGVWITELGPDGEPVVRKAKHEPLPVFGPRAMNTYDLQLEGWNDSELAKSAKELGIDYEPDRVGKSDLRREVYDRVIDLLATYD